METNCNYYNLLNNLHETRYLIQRHVNNNSSDYFDLLHEEKEELTMCFLDELSTFDDIPINLAPSLLKRLIKNEVRDEDIDELQESAEDSVITIINNLFEVQVRESEPGFDDFERETVRYNYERERANDCNEALSSYTQEVVNGLFK